mgnify:CR=1 FL=1|tara:strand:- start:221 stop:544 length:324 start_codon:yes stop_codon:yes gene_type:complete
MSDEEKLNKHYESNPEKTLITLEQLSQTIEVMTSVVNRLRQHLSEQLEDQMEGQNRPKKEASETNIKPNTDKPQNKFRTQDELETKAVLEIRQQDSPIPKKFRKIIH